MAINITKVVNEINSRLLDSGYSDLELTQLLAASSRIENSGINALTYRSTGHLPSTADSDRIGSIAYVATDNVFGDSSGRFYYASTRDSGWIAITTLQDSDEGTIEVPAGTPSGARQGTGNGFVTGGTINGTTVYNVIEKHPFASDGNGADVGDLTTTLWQHSAASSGDNIYNQGGYSPTAPNAAVDRIEKISTSVDGNSTDVANLLAPYRMGGGTQSATHGYATGNNAANNVIQKHQFSNDGDATDVGDLLTTQNRNTGTSASDDYGYLAGGYNPTQPDGDFSNQIQKWPFAADGNATDVGDLSVNSMKAYNTGTSGSTHGYSHGGQGGVPISFAHSLTIEKYSYSADGNSTDVGDLTIESTQGAGASSTTHGYGHGGTPPTTNVIQKYSFSSDGNATDVGDMLTAKFSVAGSQH